MSQESVSRAADRLNAAIELAEDLLAVRFPLGASVLLPDGHKLILMRGKLQLTDADDANAAPLCSKSLLMRKLAAETIPRLWSACEDTERHAIREVENAVVALLAFLDNVKAQP